MDTEGIVSVAPTCSVMLFSKNAFSRSPFFASYVIFFFFWTFCDIKHQIFCRVLKDRSIEYVVCINIKIKCHCVNVKVSCVFCFVS